MLPDARACYDDDGTPVSWTQEESEPAEPGVVKAWLCGDYSSETGQGFVRHEDGRYHAYDGEGRKWFWKPSEDLSVKLDEAFAGARTTDAPPTGRPMDAVEDPGFDDPVLQMPMEAGWIAGTLADLFER